jgi:hypothetical protein
VGGASILWAEIRLPAARGVHSLQAPSRSEADHCCAGASARKQLFGGVGLTGVAAFAQKVRLQPPFLWEMLAEHTLSRSEFSKRHFQCSEHRNLALTRLGAAKFLERFDTARAAAAARPEDTIVKQADAP